MGSHIWIFYLKIEGIELKFCKIINAIYIYTHIYTYIHIYIYQDLYY
jgi:hypothetical protein